MRFFPLRASKSDAFAKHINEEGIHAFFARVHDEKMEFYMKEALQLTGLGLRQGHLSDWLANPPPVAWVEVHTDNYLNEDSDLTALLKIAKKFPISLHGVGLSLGTTDELNWNYLFKLKRLIQEIKPCFVSDHLAWCSLNGRYYHDLFPLPLTMESLNHIAAKISEVQQFLGTPILIENIANYVHWKNSTMPEYDFLNLLTQKTNCKLLLDLNNVYVSSAHLGFSCDQYIESLTSQEIAAIHLGGHRSKLLNNEKVLIDTHDNFVDDNVWKLFKKTIQSIGIKPTLIEWDQQLPTLDALYNEAYRAEMLMREIYAARKRAS